MTEEKKSVFKVVDRRRFTDDGDQRSGPDVPTADPVRVEPPPPAAAAPASPGAAPADKPEMTTASGLTFSMFVQSLAQQGLMQMGLIPWPHGQRELALEQARDTIDILELLKAKTKGNLNGEEQKLMDSIVHELKFSFVEVQQAIARSRGGMKPPGVPR
jgi:hypothetical protein